MLICCVVVELRIRSHSDTHEISMIKSHLSRNRMKHSMKTPGAVDDSDKLFLYNIILVRVTGA